MRDGHEQIVLGFSIRIIKLQAGRLGIETHMHGALRRIHTSPKNEVYISSPREGMMKLLVHPQNEIACTYGARHKLWMEVEMETDVLLYSCTLLDGLYVGSLLVHACTYI